MPSFNDPAYGFDPTQTGALSGQTAPWYGNPTGWPQPPAAPQAAPAAMPAPTPQPRGALSGLFSAIAMPLVAGLAGGRNLQEGLAVADQGVQQVRDIRKRDAMNAWLKAKSSGDAGALQIATQNLYQAAPEVAQSVIAAQMTPHREFTQIGQSVMGQPTYGFVDPVAGTVSPIGGGQDGTPDAGGGIPGSNGKLYDSLPKAQQAQVDQIINGKMAYPSGFQLAKSPYWNTITAAAEERAQALGVPLDANLYPTRLKTKEAFTSGKEAQTVTAGNAAIGHLGSLDTAVDKLGNWNGVPFINYAYNAAQNAVKNASGSATDLQTFSAIKSKYSQEITKFYRASGGSDSDINEAMGQLDAARSPQELHATIKAQVSLLKSKISAMQEQWHNGMGANEPDFPLISKEAQSVLDRIAPEQAGGTSTDGASGGWTDLGNGIRIRAKP